MAQTEKHQKYLQIMRLLAEGGFTYRSLSRDFGVSQSTVNELKGIIEANGLTQDRLNSMTADELGLYLQPRKQREQNSDYLHPDFEAVARKISQINHYTRQLAWESYVDEAKIHKLLF